LISGKGRLQEKKYLMQVVDFITSVQTEEDEQLIVSALTTMAGIQLVKFDLKDGKHILRVEAKEISPLNIEKLLISRGFICVEVH
jgi:hypothetical protein